MSPTARFATPGWRSAVSHRGPGDCRRSRRRCAANTWRPAVLASGRRARRRRRQAGAGENDFKIELARRTVLRALRTVADRENLVMHRAVKASTGVDGQLKVRGAGEIRRGVRTARPGVRRVGAKHDFRRQGERGSIPRRRARHARRAGHHHRRTTRISCRCGRRRNRPCGVRCCRTTKCFTMASISAVVIAETLALRRGRPRRRCACVISRRRR